MNGLFSQIFGFEFFLSMILLAISLMLLGFKRQAGAVIIAALTVILLPIFRAFIMQFFPLWVTIVILIVISLIAFRTVLVLLLGSAADQTIGQLAADSIKSLIKVPFWLFKRLHIGSLLKRMAKLTWQKCIDIVRVRQSDDMSTLRTKNEETGGYEQVVGVVICLKGNYYCIDLGEGLTGLLPINEAGKILSIGDSVYCELITQIDEFMVQLRLTSQTKNVFSKKN